MAARLLIINCPSPYFFHIPMGTFGLCDYLNQENLSVRLLNLSMFEETELVAVLDRHLEQYKPTHVGLVLHWQETAEGVLWVAGHVKSRMKQIKTICGGFTAGYFAESFLESHPSIDYVIKGDPEAPTALVLKGADPADVPNLVYRDETGVLANEVSYYIDEETISRVSFSKLTYLFDRDSYIRAVEQKLGFPLFIGRGCVFDCAYCGGSRTAFERHSARVKPVRRSIASIIDDLKRLRGFTKKIYISYEVDRGHIKALFEAMKTEKELIKAFRLSYGAWTLFDREFLALYRELFLTGQGERPIFELSPEVMDDRDREKIKGHKTYSMEDLKNNVGLINDVLEGRVKVYLFFSRYHDTTRAYASVREEIFRIFRLEHEFLVEGRPNVRVYYDHLSTDVGSIYWERYLAKPRNFGTLISWTEKLKEPEMWGLPPNNFCVFRPETLSQEDMVRCELSVLVLKRLEKSSHELFHILFLCLGRGVMDAIETLIEQVYLKRPERVLGSLDQRELLRDLEQIIAGEPSLLAKIPFIRDLTDFEIKKANGWHRPPGPGRLKPTGRARLNRRLLSTNDHDYADLLNFLKKIQKHGVHGLTPQKTVFIFLSDDILSMSYETYGVTLKAFESETSIEEYCDLMDKRRIFDREYHEDLLCRMIESNVLIVA